MGMLGYRVIKGLSKATQYTEMGPPMPDKCPDMPLQALTVTTKNLGAPGTPEVWDSTSPSSIPHWYHLAWEREVFGKSRSGSWGLDYRL